MRTAAIVAFAALGAAAVLAAPPTWPNDWTSVEEDFALVYQGAYSVIDNQYCCGDDNCEVQTEYQSGHNYFDYSHQRTRFDDPAQGSIVSLFNPIYKEMAVDANNTCTSYCPIEGDLDPYAININSTDMGQKVVDNVTCEDWQYKDMAFGIIVMEIDDIYVNQAASPPTPIFEEDQLTPFGEPIGYETSNYLSFVFGTPDPSHFVVNGVDTCPQDPNCGDSFRQFARRRNRSRKMWLKYYSEQRAQRLQRAAEKHKQPRAGRPQITEL